MKLKLTATAALLATLTLSNAALAADIIVWHHGGRGDGERETIQKQIVEWNRQNEDKAILEVLPEGSYTEQVQAAALAGKLPDLLDFDGPNYANYVWSGYLQPLNGLVSQSVIDGVSPGIIAQGTYPADGKLYSLGQNDSGLSIWGRKSLLEAAGVRIPTSSADAWSGAEFEEALDKLQALDGIEYALDVKMNYGKGEWFTYGFSPIVQSYGGDLINRTTWRAEGTLNSDASVKAMTAFQSWVKDGHVAPASTGDDTFFGQKTSALSFVGHWMWGAHSKAFGDDLVLLPMPNFGGTHVTGNGSWTWGVTKSSKDAKHAAKLLEFLLADERLAVWEGNGAPPSTLSAMANSPKFGKGGALNMYTQQLSSGIAVPRPAHPAYPVITASFAQAVADIADGADVAEALTKAAQAIDEDIEDNEGYPPFGQ
ncbi:MAG: sugar ABC transporter substrate-binding protein [Granulosicoccus sp.]|nr:sugar ABC transporter substrate-binding protein [Granulosicoccus sp.]